MKILLSALAALSLFAVSSFAQCDASGLSVTITPDPVSPGSLATVTVTNTTSSCTYTFPSGCVFRSVHPDDCSNPSVLSLFCTSVLVPLPPGQSKSQTWDLTDDLGNPVAFGTYAFDIDIFDPNFNLLQLCPTVNVGPNCPQLPQQYGTGSAGTGGFVPDLASQGTPFIGNPTFSIIVSNGVGGAPAALFLGAQAGSIPANWGTFLVNPNPVLIQVPLLLGGAPGGPGIGSFIATTGIPNQPALVGTDVFLQTLIQDAGSTGGISTTNGLQISICG